MGSYKSRMLSLTARLADGWVPSQAYASPEETERLSERLDVLAQDAGREPADILRIYNVNGRFAPNGRGFLDGPPAQWAEQLAELVLKQGFSSFVLGASGDIIASISTFADEVVPDVRERVLAERSGTATGAAAGSVRRRGDRRPAESSSAEPPGEIKLERDGNWGSAGGLPVTDRPRAVRAESGSSATGSVATGAGQPGGPGQPPQPGRDP